MRPTGPRELLSGKLKEGVLKKQVKMLSRKEEKASGGWQSGLSQKVSFHPHHHQFHPSQGPATKLEAKCDALKAWFFPLIPPADL